MSTLAIVTASFVGGIVGGPIVDGLGWRASQWIPLIWIAAGFVAQIFLLPETIYHRSRHLPSSSAAGMSPPVKRSMWAQYGVSVPKQDMEREHGFWFIATRPFVLFRYPAVILPSIWFGIVFSMMVGITAVIPLIFEPQFGFSELDVGLASFSGLIGALLGEAWAGPSINYLTRRVTMRGKEFKPEIVLGALWPALIAAPGGLVMFGTSIQFGSAWITPLIGWGLYSFGVEVGTTTMCVQPLSPFTVSCLALGIGSCARVPDRLPEKDRVGPGRVEQTLIGSMMVQTNLYHGVLRTTAGRSQPCL